MATSDQITFGSLYLDAMTISKTKRISMAVSAEERANIELGAAIAGVSMSRFVVDAAVRAAERTGLRFVDTGDGRFSCPRCQTPIDAEFL